jgi:tryptophanyl-tRNA synthetase
MLRVLLALGLGDGGVGGGSTVFVQSHVKQHAELMWILSCTASMGYLGRMTQWKVRLVPSETQFYPGEWKGKVADESRVNSS